MNSFRVAAGILRDPDGRVLIAERVGGGPFQGMWEFPGGKLKAGEELAYCLKREIDKQLEVNLQVGQELGVYHHAYTHFRVTLHAYACTLRNGNEPVNREHQALKWVSSKEMTRAVGAKLMTDYSQFIPSTTAALATRLYTEYGLAEQMNVPFNCVVTNVPGPQIPLYSAGARLVT